MSDEVAVPRWVFADFLNNQPGWPDTARRYLNAPALASPAKATGWQTVPVEPTDHMLNEAVYYWGPWLDEEKTQRAGRRSDDPADRERARAVWAQMLAAVPTTPIKAETHE